MSLVGRKAPLFSSPAVINGNKIVENFSLDKYIGEKYIVFFFYPGDFTFVCPTELIAFQKHLKEFEKRGAVVIACSTDSQYSHLKWLQTPKEEGGIKGVEYPIIADQSMVISINYGVLGGTLGITENGEAVFDGVPVAYRGLFIIDKQGVVRYETVNDLSVGRSVKETLRILDAIIYTDKYGVVCPADWTPDQEPINPNFEDVKNYLKKQ